ncbi:hypothetical protein D3C76_900400 [compost metagenome]
MPAPGQGLAVFREGEHLHHVLAALSDRGAPFVAGVEDRLAFGAFLFAVGVGQLHFQPVMVVAVGLDGGVALVGAPARTMPGDAPVACDVGLLVLQPLVPGFALVGVELAEGLGHLLRGDFPPVAVAAAGLDLDGGELADMEVRELAPVVLGAPLQGDAPVGMAARAGGGDQLVVRRFHQGVVALQQVAPPGGLLRRQAVGIGQVLHQRLAFFRGDSHAMGHDHPADGHVPAFGRTPGLVDAVHALLFQGKVASHALAVQQRLGIGCGIRMDSQRRHRQRD